MLKKLAAQRFLMYHKDTSNSKNCLDDTDHFLLDLKSLVSKPIIVGSERPAAESEDLLTKLCQHSFSLTDHDYTQFSFQIPQEKTLQEEMVLAYIGGFIVRKISAMSQVWFCRLCVECIASSSDPANQSYDLIESKQHQGCLKGLQYLSISVVKLLQEAEIIYGRVVNEVMHMSDVRKRLVSCLQNECSSVSSLSCSACYIGQYILQMFVSIRLHHSLKLVNMSLSQSRSTRCRKLMKISNM